MTHLSFLPAMRTTALLLLCCLCSCATIINGRSSTASTRFSTADVLVDSRGDTLSVQQKYTDGTGEVTYDHTRTRIVARKKADSTWEYWYSEVQPRPAWYIANTVGVPAVASIANTAFGGRNSNIGGALGIISAVSTLFGSAIDASLGSANSLEGFYLLDTSLYSAFTNTSTLPDREQWQHLEDSLARVQEWRQYRTYGPQALVNLSFGAHTFPTNQIFVAPILLSGGIKLNNPEGPLIGLDVDWALGIFNLFPTERGSSSFLLPSISVSERVFGTAPFYVGAGAGVSFDIDQGTLPSRPFIVGSAFVQAPWLSTSLRCGYVFEKLSYSHSTGLFLMFSLGIAFGV